MDVAAIIARINELEPPAQQAATQDDGTPDFEAQLAVARALLVGRDARIEQLEAELAQARDASATQEPENSHLLFVPSSSGYSLVQCAGPTPRPGDKVELDGLTYAVTRRGRSPLPGDTRRCAYLVAHRAALPAPEQDGDPPPAAPSTP